MADERSTPKIENHLSRAMIRAPRVLLLVLSAYLLLSAFFGLKSVSLAEGAYGPMSRGFAVGLFAAAILEYLIHRYVLHIRGAENVVLREIEAIHLLHHAYPKRIEFSSLPVGASLFLISATCGLFYLAIRPEAALLSGFAGGVTLGYVWHEWVHYSAHHRKPMTRLGRFLTRFHMKHHFGEPELKFAVGLPLTDALCGSWSQPEARRSAELDQ